MVKRITDQPAEVTEYVDKREKETAPLPYSLSALQLMRQNGLACQHKVCWIPVSGYNEPSFDYLSAF